MRRHGEGDETALRRRTPSFHAAAKGVEDAKDVPPSAPLYSRSGSSSPRAAVPAVYTADGHLESGLEEDYEDEVAEERPLLNGIADHDGTSSNDDGRTDDAEAALGDVDAEVSMN